MLPLDPQFLIVQTLNGLQLSALLFLLSIGLSVVFGLMNFINLAHGTLYMIGAYLALSAVRAFDSFWLALLLAPLGVALLGGLLYLVLLRHMQRADPMRQVLVTFGLIFVGFEVADIIWGSLPHVIEVPALLAGRSRVLGQVYPTYRLFIIALGVAVFLLLYLGLERTRLGAICARGGRQPHHGGGARHRYRPRVPPGLLPGVPARRARRGGGGAGVLDLPGHGHVGADPGPDRGGAGRPRQPQGRGARLAHHPASPTPTARWWCPSWRG